MNANSVATAADACLNGLWRRILTTSLLVLIGTTSDGQIPASIEIKGHVLRNESQIPLQNVLVVAWPCGQTTTTNRSGFYQVLCPSGIDSITCTASFFKTSTISVRGRDHIDFWLTPLEVEIDQVAIETMHSPELEAQRFSGPDLMQVFDHTPGLQSLDLGDAMVQPVIRGLLGSRVALLEDGIPQQGGRWGSDHGILADPVLYGSMEWVPGGGHLWMGPESVGGGLRLTAPKPLEYTGSMTTWGSSFRQGDNRMKSHILHAIQDEDRFWYLGTSGSVFGNQNIPQASFTYLGRSYALTDNVLPNTAGHSLHGTVGTERPTHRGGRVESSIRFSDVIQGLFPGIVGVPRQGDLEANSRLFLVEIPQQHATRLQTTGIWKTPAGQNGSSRSVKASVSWNRRLELAPPHAHGWGPEPSSNLSLSLEEWTGYLESTWRGAHGTFGVQFEGLTVATSGWEFLLPSHHRLRCSVLGEKRIGPHQFGVRADIVSTAQQGHEEPLYDASSTVVGADPRADHMQRLIPGGMASWLANIEPISRDWTGTASVVVYTRAPSNYELGANGIHHGTFRFEKGSPLLQSEKSIEARFQGHSKGSSAKFEWRIQAFSALHQDFIALGPSATFAPISHAGQVYTFTAVNAFRTGLEASVSTSQGAWLASADGSLLGQWDISTGLGLPFTTPAQVYSTIGRNLGKNHQLKVACRAIADAKLTARNESPTEGALLWELAWSFKQKAGTWSMNIHNISNTAWLDHTSAYRALGLVAQGRWMQISFVTSMKQLNKNN
jgi:iron complex outermembrane receptor protein